MRIDLEIEDKIGLKIKCIYETIYNKNSFSPDYGASSQPKLHHQMSESAESDSSGKNGGRRPSIEERERRHSLNPGNIHEFFRRMSMGHVSRRLSLRNPGRKTRCFS